MATENFARSLSCVLVSEGGWSNHPEDPGGATMKGIIQRVYDGYRKGKGLAVQSVRYITDAEVSDIYRSLYWNAVRGDELPVGVDYFVFDGAVNAGPVQAVKWLQRALNMNNVDGVIGPATLAAIQAHPDYDLLIAAMGERRRAFYRALKTFRTFGNGWMARVKKAVDRGQAWATGSVGPAPVFEGGNAKALAQQARKPPSRATADAVAGAGGATSIGIGSTIDQAKSAIEPLAGSSEWATRIVVALTVVSVLVTIGSLIYGQWVRRRQATLADALDLPAAGVVA